MNKLTTNFWILLPEVTFTILKHSIHRVSMIEENHSDMLVLKTTRPIETIAEFNCETETN